MQACLFKGRRLNPSAFPTSAFINERRQLLTTQYDFRSKDPDELGRRVAPVALRYPPGANSPPLRTEQRNASVDPPVIPAIVPWPVLRACHAHCRRRRAYARARGARACMPMPAPDQLRLRAQGRSWGRARTRGGRVRARTARRRTTARPAERVASVLGALSGRRW